MARYGVLGDIHGNREALDVVLEALQARGVRQFLCVGDIVGYNADSDYCIARIASLRCTTISGNHDLISTGRLGLRRCANKPMYSLKRTRRTLSAQGAAWLRTLPSNAVVDRDIVLVHGGVREVEQYMAGAGQIRENAAYLAEDFPQARVCFFGHSHEQRIYEVDAGEAQERAPAMEFFQLKKEATYFINPGSVDASRKRAGRLAECATFDTEARTIEFLRLPYDAASTEIKAGMGGFRIGPWTDRAYTYARRAEALGRKALASIGGYRTTPAPATYRRAQKG
jgi:predicted phosphodiesterase